MPRHISRHVLHVILAWLTARHTTWRARPDDGSHTTEYAIGIGLSAAIAIALMAAYRTGIDKIVDSWFFTGGD